MTGKSVTIKELAETLGFRNLTPWIDLGQVCLSKSSINRPAFQLAGFFEFFDNARLQITGEAESEYMSRLSSAERSERYDKLFALGFPAIIYARGLQPFPEAYDAARKYRIPILSAKDETGKAIVDVVTWLSEKMAPMETRHGVLMDIFGEGVLITGNTGIGKSETAIELIKRGQRLVADDLVEIYKTNEQTLRGSAPVLTRHFVELRGIGVVDIKSLYGVESVKTQQKIDMIIQLEQWDGNANYDRLGLEEHYEEILGVKVVKHNVPVRSGRNLAIIIETAAVNNRQKKMGYNAANELVTRVREEVRRNEVR